MVNQFSCYNDIRQYCSDQLERYDATQYNMSHDELIDSFAEELRKYLMNLDYCYFQETPEITQEIWDEFGRKVEKS